MAIIIIGYLIAAGIRSASKNVSSVDPDFNEKFQEVKKNMGPMTWQERIVSAILIMLIIAISIGLAMIT